MSHVGEDPAPAQAPVQRRKEAPGSGVAARVSIVSGLASRLHVSAPPPHAIRAPVITPPAGGVTMSEATLPRRRVEPLKRSRSTFVEIPETLPVEVHCQNVHPRPPQFPAGTVGVATPQCAIHSGYPLSANHVVSPRYVRQKWGLA